MNAVSQFKNGEYDNAMNAFIELDINPAKIVALYPESVAGRLHVDSEQWIPLFGGPSHKVKPSRTESKEARSSTGTGRTPSPAASLRSIRPLRKGTLETLFSGTGASSNVAPSSGSGIDERASIRGRLKEKAKAAGRFLFSPRNCLLNTTTRVPFSHLVLHHPPPLSAHC